MDYLEKRTQALQSPIRISFCCDPALREQSCSRRCNPPGFPVSGRKNPAVTADLPGSRGSAGILSAGIQTPFFPLWSMGDPAAIWFIHQVIRPFPIKTAVGRRCASHRFRQPVNRKHFERGSAWFFLPGAARAAAASTAGSGIRAFLPLKKRFIVSCRKKLGLFL